MYRRARQRCFWLLAFISRPHVGNIHLLGRMILPGVKLINFYDSGSVWVQQRFQISFQFRLRFRLNETHRFGFALVKNISIPVNKVSVRVRSKKWHNSSNTI